MKKLLLSLMLIGSIVVLSNQNLQGMQNQENACPQFGKIINQFAGKTVSFEVNNFLNPVKLIEYENQRKIYRFFGIQKENQENLQNNPIFFRNLKRAITQKMGVRNNKTIQLIGDSNQFSEEGTIFARNFLNEKLFSGNHLIEYGYTGHLRPRELDVNSFVNEFIEQKPQEAYRVLGNVVGHTEIALTKWGCKVSPQIHNFVVVYNKFGMEEPNFTKFGDDVIMSDMLLNAEDGDEVICLEGGAQSFKQITNSLKGNLKINLVLNLRKLENRPFFSAALFLSLVNDAFDGQTPPSPEKVQAIYEEYNQTLKSTWDSSRPDHMTKKALFEQAIKEFIEEGTYKLLKSNCTFCICQ